MSQSCIVTLFMRCTIKNCLYGAQMHKNCLLQVSEKKGRDQTWASISSPDHYSVLVNNLTFTYYLSLNTNANNYSPLLPDHAPLIVSCLEIHSFFCCSAFLRDFSLCQDRLRRDASELDTPCYIALGQALYKWLYPETI